MYTYSCVWSSRERSATQVFLWKNMCAIKKERVLTTNAQLFYLGSRTAGSSSSPTAGPSAKTSDATTPDEKSRSFASAPMP